MPHYHHTRHQKGQCHTTTTAPSKARQASGFDVSAALCLYCALKAKDLRILSIPGGISGIRKGSYSHQRWQLVNPLNRWTVHWGSSCHIKDETAGKWLCYHATNSTRMGISSHQLWMLAVCLPRPGCLNLNFVESISQRTIQCVALKYINCVCAISRPFQFTFYTDDFP